MLKFRITYLEGSSEEVDSGLVQQYKRDRTGNIIIFGSGCNKSYLAWLLEKGKPLILSRNPERREVSRLINSNNIKGITFLEENE
jgi:hypothetical protein